MDAAGIDVALITDDDNVYDNVYDARASDESKKGVKELLAKVYSKVQSPQIASPPQGTPATAVPLGTRVLANWHPL